MPSQQIEPKVVYYTMGDTAPPLEVCLKDGANEPIDLTGCTVTISIAHAPFARNYERSAGDRIVDEGPCVLKDQVTDTGWIEWWPESGDLFPAGDFRYTFEITYQSGKTQTIPSNTELPLIIRSTVGGKQYYDAP